MLPRRGRIELFFVFLPRYPAATTRLIRRSDPIFIRASVVSNKHIVLSYLAVDAVGDTMGTFYAKCKIENLVDRRRSVIVPKLLIDTGSEYT